MKSKAKHESTFTISADVINDATHEGHDGILEEIISTARSTLADGRYVILIQEYEDAPPDTLAVFRDSAGFEKWVADRNTMRTALGKPEIGGQ